MEAVKVLGEMRQLTAPYARERVEPAEQRFDPCGHPVPDDFALHSPTFPIGG